MARLGLSLTAALAAVTAIALALGRAPAIVESSWAVVVDRAPALLESLESTWAAASALGSEGADRISRSRDWAQREVASAREAWAMWTAEPVVVAAADPPIRVRVNSDPWSNVEVDGVAAGATPLTIDLAPGPHAFRAELSDGRVIERMVHVSADLDRIAFN